MKQALYALELLLLMLCGNGEEKHLKCLPKHYGFDGIVCMCNADHCDTIEPPKPISSNEYNLYLTSQSGLRFEYSQGKFVNEEKRAGIQVKVDPKTTYQKIYGFGGAFTDSAGINIKSLKQKTQEKLIASYFSPDGIEYNFGRVPIGGSDFSVRKYTLDDEAGDITLKNFNLSLEDIQFKIPIIREALKQSKRRIHLIGAAWTAPPWMKSNDDYTCFGILKKEFYKIWALYHIRFLEEYEKRGLRFWGLSTGNEPTAGLLPYYSFNCMGWTPFTQSRWVSQNLGPQLSKTKFNKTFIVGIDDQRFTIPWWPIILFKNKETQSYIAGLGLHWYWDNYFPPILLDWTHRLFPNKFILSTEACFVKEASLPAVNLGSWKRGEKYAENIMNNLNHYVGGWIDWNLALNLEGGPNWAKNFVDAPIIVNASAGEFYKQPMFYALGHFSKFVPENSVRIHSSKQSNSNLNFIGFLTPQNNVVVVLLNKSNKPILVNVQGEQGTASIQMQKKSIATLIYKNTNFSVNNSSKLQRRNSDRFNITTMSQSLKAVSKMTKENLHS